MKSVFGLLAIACCAIPVGAGAQSRPPVASAPFHAHPTSLAIAHRDAAPSDAADRISLDLIDVPLGDALAETAHLSRLHLVYADGLIPGDVRVTLEMDEITPALAFSILLASTNLRVVFSPSGYGAIVKRQTDAKVVGAWNARMIGLPHSTAVRAVDRRAIARGVVLDDNGRPIAGAYVRICGTRRVELTDSLGRFAFPWHSGALARVSASAVQYSEFVARVPVSGAGETPHILRLDSGQRDSRGGVCPEPTASSRW